MTPSIKRVVVLVVSALLILTALLVLVLLSLQERPVQPVPRVGQLPVLVASVGEAKEELPRLVVVDRLSVDAFVPGAFSGWEPVADTPCDTEQLVLVSTGIGVKTTGRCKPVSGEWLSWFDGKAVFDPADAEVEHLVPLRNAWASGASAWPADKRASFANTFTEPELAVMTTELSLDRRDRGPELWKPPVRAAWCRYAASWVVVKAAWGLSVSTAERAALGAMLQPCEE